MAQKTAQQTRLIGERVKALTTILMTRREDVSILEVTEDLGLDFIVTINHEEKSGLRQFGVDSVKERDHTGYLGGQGYQGQSTGRDCQKYR
jgi:hypothetical protein